MSETIGVFGGAGCIGSHIVKNLLSKGHKVIVMDDLSSYPFDQIERFGLKDLDFEFVKGSIINKELVDSVIKRCDRVINLISLTDVGLSIRDPEKCFNTDIIGCHNILESCFNHKIKKLVYASSASVYGSPEWINGKPQKMSEDGKIYPISNYALVKFFNESLLRLYYELYGFQTTSLRYFSVWGIPQTNKKNSHSWMIPIFISQTIKKKPLTIIGDGLQVRDMTHISEIAEATVESLFNDKTNGKVFNVGTGKPTSIIEIVNEIKKYFPDLKIVNVEKKKGDPLGCYADSNLMKELLGWTPKIRIEDRMEETIQWFLDDKKRIQKFI